MKICSVCKTDLPHGSFHKNKGSKDGLSSICKQCKKKKDREYLENNREKIKQTKRKYKEKNRDRLNERNRKYDSEYRKRSYVVIRNKIRQKTRRMIINNEIIKTPCEVCGSKQVEAHHKDYNFPEKVTFLCSEHHRAWHMKDKAIYPML